MTPLSRGGVKIGNVYLRKKLNETPPVLEIGLWNSSDEAAGLDLNELKELRTIVNGAIIDILEVKSKE